MDVSTIAALATDMAEQRTAMATSVLVLRKALDIQAQSAAQLIEAAAQPVGPARNPPHLGNSIDVMA